MSIQPHLLVAEFLAKNILWFGPIIAAIIISFTIGILSYTMFALLTTDQVKKYVQES